MVVMTEVAQVLSDDNVSDKQALKTVSQLVNKGSSKNLLSTQTELQQQPQVLEGCAKLLVRQNSRVGAQACRALGTFAFGSDGVATQITRAPNMLDNLATLMSNDDKESQLEAARLICNCASYSHESAESIAQNQATLTALLRLCKSKDAQVRGKAIGAVSCLSVCPASVEVLKNTSVVDDCLMPCVGTKKGMFDSKDVFDATRLDAFTAIINLDRHTELSSSTAREAIKTFKACFECALRGKPWAGVTWSPYTVLLPLSKLSMIYSNRAFFHELKMVKLLASAFANCHTVSETTLALQNLANVSSDPGCMASMRKPKYNLVPLSERKLSDEHARPLARFFLDALQREPEVEQKEIQETKKEDVEADDANSSNDSNLQDRKVESEDHDSVAAGSS